MSNTWRWIIGIAVALIIIALLFTASSDRQDYWVARGTVPRAIQVTRAEDLTWSVFLATCGQDPSRLPKSAVSTSGRSDQANVRLIFPEVWAAQRISHLRTGLNKTLQNRRSYLCYLQSYGAGLPPPHCSSDISLPGADYRTARSVWLWGSGLGRCSAPSPMSWSPSQSCMAWAWQSCFASGQSLSSGQIGSSTAWAVRIARISLGTRLAAQASAIFIGTLLDNVPESLILGMSLALGGAINLAFLAAVFISNLPEGVAGSINLEAAGRSRRNIFWMWTALVIISAACAGLGYIMIHWLPGVDGRLCPGFCRRSNADHAGGCNDARGL